MSLKQVLLDDMKAAMKDKDTLRKNAITMVRAGILQIEKDKKTELDDEAILEVIAKAVKQRKDSIPEFEKGNRPDLVEDLKREIDILMAYLPQQLSEDELDSIVSQTIFEVGAQSAKDIGKVMKALLPKTKGRADGRLVNELVKKHLD
ncbi:MULTISPECIES: GatB/YqeY domain-containing protein [Lutispora]|uniref:GatB/YqeY domain-containing protein n=1 Tax=Lutispora saccharofermentans TaxID=3024236 RepID=A0ABT1NI16_9FIRM|nr:MULTISPECIES: GatB/YqeY domain-containing protein [Lutispora]MCQ1530863.1 GatB/YqeY domain-containing protein [Lutispora saccharofermentans]MEA4960346.1 GatB/YqeY domain-containing protein [Lutispora sp.]